jgi:hypothetical protein
VSHAPGVDTEFNPQYGNGSKIDDKGWLIESFSVPLSVGDNHELVIGAYNNNATYSDESMEVFIDEITVVIIPDTPPPPNEIIIDNGDEGTTFTGTWEISGAPDPYGENSLFTAMIKGRATLTMHQLPEHIRFHYGGPSMRSGASTVCRCKHSMAIPCWIPYM